MAHVSRDILSESIRHELRTFAEDTFQAELMRVGNQVEQGLREELREFLKVWADSEGRGPNTSDNGQLFSDEVMDTLTPTQDDDQSGWFKRVRKFHSTSHGNHGSRIGSKSGGGSLLMAPTISDSPSDGFLLRHPKRFAVGQEMSDHDQSTGDHPNRAEEVGSRVRPPPPGASEPLRVIELSTADTGVANAWQPSPTTESTIVKPFVSQKSMETKAANSWQPSPTNESTAVRPFAAHKSIDTNINEKMGMAGIVPTLTHNQNDSVLEDSLVRIKTSGRRMSVTSLTDSAGNSLRLLESLSVPQPRWKRIVSDIVLDPKFDYVTGVLIVLNSIVIGVQTDYMARHTESDEVPVPFAVIERIFCVAFTLELCLRLSHFGKFFFYGSGWRWNIFDAVIVALQLIEEIMNGIALITESDKHGQQIESFSIMRMLRVLRLIRIIRLVRVLRLISELRTIVVSIIGSMRSLVWTILLLVLMMYIIGVFLTQLVSQHLVAHGDKDADGDGNPDLGLYYDNLGRSILTLFQSISGGVDWDNSVQPLMTYVSPWLALMFCFYIAFAVFALFNIVTGVFVESALATAKGDQDILLMHNVRQLFASTDIDRKGNFTWQDFERQLDNEQMVMYFQAIDLDKEEARELFKLIDIDESGCIDPEEFLNGCFRLRGPAKALDLAVLMHETKRINKKWFAHVRYVETALSLLLRQGIPSQHRSPKPLAVV